MNRTKAFFLSALLATAPVCAYGETTVVPRAAAPVEISSFERYPSYSLDEATGKWSVHTNQTDALLERFWDYDSRYNTELCIFHLSVEGNAQTGIWSPVLKFYYADGRDDINATAVSILVDGVRYDLAAASGWETNAGGRAEVITAPLTAESLEVIDAMNNGTEIRIRLIGDEIYTTELDRTSRIARRQMEAASLEGLAASYQQFLDAGLADYELWDLSAAAWDSKYGFEPACIKSTVSLSIGDVAIEDDFGMILPYTRGKTALAAQEILINSGFLSGQTTEYFGDKAESAVRRAQQFLGLIETGCMDAQLVQALNEAPTTEEPAVPELHELANTAQLSLNRYWFADGVSASREGAGLRTVSNSDNVFLVADGYIRNLSAAQLHLFMQVEAKVVYRDLYRFDASVVCEANQGRALDTLMLPMAQSRLLVYAEVPAYLAMEDDGAWKIELTVSGETLSLNLE